MGHLADDDDPAVSLAAGAGLPDVASYAADWYGPPSVARIGREERTMDRIPEWVWLLTASVFVGMAIWSATDENWSGVIVSLVLAGLSLGLLRDRKASR